MGGWECVWPLIQQILIVGSSKIGSSLVQISSSVRTSVASFKVEVLWISSFLCRS